MIEIILLGMLPGLSVGYLIGWLHAHREASKTLAQLKRVCDSACDAENEHGYNRALRDMSQAGALKEKPWPCQTAVVEEARREVEGRG